MTEPTNGKQQTAAEPLAAAAEGPPAAPSKTVKISFKVSGGAQFALDVHEDWTVRTLKEHCQQQADIPVAAQRLIYKGRILKDDDLVSSQGLKDGHIMHIVKSVAAAAAAANTQQQQQQQQQQQTQQTPAAAAATPSPAAAAAGGAGGSPPVDPLLQAMLSGGLGGVGVPAGFPLGGPEMNQMIQSPFFQQAMDSLVQNPQMFRSIVENVPALRPMLPMMQGILDNPERMRAMFNPQMMQASMQMHQAMQQMRQQQGASDSAAGAPGSLFAAPGAAAAAAAAGGQSGPQQEAANPLGSMGSAGSNAAFASVMQQAEQMMRQNPELMSQMMQAFMGGPQAAAAGGGGAAGGAAAGNPFAALNSLGSFGSLGAFPGAAAADNRPPEERFASQLQSLTDMGFIDRDANLAALQETNGDVNAAITRLLERGLGN